MVSPHPEFAWARLEMYTLSKLHSYLKIILNSLSLKFDCWQQGQKWWKNANISLYTVCCNNLLPLNKFSFKLNFFFQTYGTLHRSVTNARRLQTAGTEQFDSWFLSQLLKGFKLKRKTLIGKSKQFKHSNSSGTYLQTVFQMDQCLFFV